jgi:hypothetical protein
MTDHDEVIRQLRAEVEKAITAARGYDAAFQHLANEVGRLERDVTRRLERIEEAVGLIARRVLGAPGHDVPPVASLWNDLERREAKYAPPQPARRDPRPDPLFAPSPERWQREVRRQQEAHRQARIAEAAKETQ